MMIFANIMIWITIKLLEITVKKCKKRQVILKTKGGGDAIVAQAYGNMIKNYESSILYLNAQIGKT